VNIILTSDLTKDNLIHNNACLVKGCINLKTQEDNLFCNNHRIKWRSICNVLWPEENISMPINNTVDFENVMRKLKMFIHKEI